MSDDLIARLERVEAQLAIQQLPVGYAMSVDARDFDALAKLYVPDIDYGEAGRGAEGIKNVFTKTTELFYRSVHQILGHQIEFQDADHATGKVYCKAEHEAGDKWIVAAMCYFDKYVRQDGKWYFAAKREYDFFYCCDHLEHPQDVDFQRFVVPGMKLDVPMMIGRAPSWKAFWDTKSDELVSKLTAHR